jgi:uncharacterized protein
VYWYEKAADAGCKKAPNRLGVMYDNGLCVQRDFAEAARWHEKAASRGDLYSMLRFAGMSYNGIGVDKDFKKAFKWYQEAALQGDVNAQYSLAMMYFNGQGVGRDDVMAYALISLVVERGEAVAARQQDIMRSRMTPEQVAAAGELAGQLQAKLSL